MPSDQEYSDYLTDYYNTNGAYVFLDGECHIFAKALHDKYGYTIRKFSDDAHFFCESEVGGKHYYIDVRGIISDDVVFLRDLTAGLSIEKITDLDSNDIYENVCQSSEYLFARTIMDKYPRLYNIREAFRTEKKR